MKFRHVLVFAVIVAPACLAAPPAPATLADYSYAGYHDGEKTIPSEPVTVSVKVFGAKGDGVTDDSSAFAAAIAKTDHGVIFIPEGRYVLGSPVTISKSNLVLTGAGEDKTTLVVPKSLQQLAPKALSKDDKLSYAFGGGFIQVKGQVQSSKLGDVAPAKRGDTTITLVRPVSIKPGDTVRLLMNNSASLGRYLHGDLFDAGKATTAHKNYVEFTAHVLSVTGAHLKLDRPLRTDIRPEWQPVLYSSRNTVEEVGIEHLTFEFPGVPKKKHLQEEGFNAVHFVSVANCWVQHVTTIDADLGVKLDASRNCSVQNVTVKAAKRSNPTGHHALWVSGGSQDNLFTDFNIDTQFVHDLSVEGFANGNVFSHGRGQALNLDHHRNAPYQNLFTDLTTNDVSRLWQSSGRADRGPHSGAWETVWNVKYSAGKLPAVPDWPLLTVVGVKGYPSTPLTGIIPAKTPDLYMYQLQARTKEAPFR